MTHAATSSSAHGPSGRTRDRLVTAFRWGNRRVMLPLLASPVGQWLNSPVNGYFLTLTTRGRRSGAPRRTPLDYAIIDGSVYLLSGFGPAADWYRNLVADPHVRLDMAERVIEGTAWPVADPQEAARAAIAVCRNAGFALLAEGLNPMTTTDDELRAHLAGRPVVRVEGPHPIRPGRHDPGSRTWLVPYVLIPASLALVAARRRRVVGGAA